MLRCLPGLLLLCAAPAFGQAPATDVSYSTGVFTWTYPLAQQPNVVFWQFHCKEASQSDTRLYDYPNPAARSIPIKDVLPAPGVYACTLRAGNAKGVSGHSNPVNFRAADVPVPPASFNVSDQ